MKGNFTSLAVVSGINPIIDPEPKARDLRFRIVFKETGEEDFLRVSNQVGVGVFEIKDVRRGSYDQAAFPGKHAGYFKDGIGETTFLSIRLSPSVS